MGVLTSNERYCAKRGDFVKQWKQKFISKKSLVGKTALAIRFAQAQPTRTPSEIWSD
jgi:hypothetical protein